MGRMGGLRDGGRVEGGGAVRRGRGAQHNLAIRPNSYSGGNLAEAI